MLFRCTDSEFVHDVNKASYLVWDCDYVVVDGHHRLHALKSLIQDKAPDLPTLVTFVLVFNSINYAIAYYSIVGAHVLPGKLLHFEAALSIGAVCFL
jgi:uncharacterized protein (DUF1015 family)